MFLEARKLPRESRVDRSDVGAVRRVHFRFAQACDIRERGEKEDFDAHQYRLTKSAQISSMVFRTRFTEERKLLAKMLNTRFRPDLVVM